MDGRKSVTNQKTTNLYVDWRISLKRCVISHTSCRRTPIISQALVSNAQTLLACCANFVTVSFEYGLAIDPVNYMQCRLGIEVAAHGTRGIVLTLYSKIAAELRATAD